ncbi:hypothetical protein SNEBB_001259 [Seison nebaliae]|nr:hypothetical protein SNEBB_001259 [Seison nebaliae]
MHSGTDKGSLEIHQFFHKHRSDNESYRYENILPFNFNLNMPHYDSYYGELDRLRSTTNHQRHQDNKNQEENNYSYKSIEEENNQNRYHQNRNKNQFNSGQNRYNQNQYNHNYDSYDNQTYYEYSGGRKYSANQYDPYQQSRHQSQNFNSRKYLMERIPTIERDYSEERRRQKKKRDMQKSTSPLNPLANALLENEGKERGLGKFLRITDITSPNKFNEITDANTYFTPIGTRMKPFVNHQQKTNVPIENINSIDSNNSLLNNRRRSLKKLYSDFNGNYLPSYKFDTNFQTNNSENKFNSQSTNNIFERSHTINNNNNNNGNKNYMMNNRLGVGENENEEFIRELKDRMYSNN